MKYTYAYKTSDGARHEAAMEAESREAVFAALRARGIKTIFAVFPPECTAERDAAQGLYAETMEKLDSSERRIVKDEKALRLLVENRGKWHWQDGKVVWSDAALANEFEYFRRETSPQQKPRTTVIESQVVELPPAK